METPQESKGYLREDEPLACTMVSNRIEVWKVHLGTVRTRFECLEAVLPVKMYCLTSFETAPLLMRNLLPTSEKVQSCASSFT